MTVMFPYKEKVMQEALFIELVRHLFKFLVKFDFKLRFWLSITNLMGNYRFDFRLSLLLKNMPGIRNKCAMIFSAKRL